MSPRESVLSKPFARDSRDVRASLLFARRGHQRHEGDREDDLFGQAAVRALLDPQQSLAGSVAARAVGRAQRNDQAARSEEHTSELQSLMRLSYDVLCFEKKNK